MEKRVFLAIALSLLVLTVYQAYFAPPPPTTTPAPAAVANQPVDTSAPQGMSSPSGAGAAGTGVPGTGAPGTSSTTPV